MLRFEQQEPVHGKAPFCDMIETLPLVSIRFVEVPNAPGQRITAWRVRQHSSASYFRQVTRDHCVLTRRFTGRNSLNRSAHHSAMRIRSARRAPRWSVRRISSAPTCASSASIASGDQKPLSSGRSEVLARKACDEERHSSCSRSGSFGILTRRKNGTTVAGQAFDFAQDFQNRRCLWLLVQAAGFVGGQAPRTSCFCFPSKR